MKASDFFEPHPELVSVECRPDYVLAVAFDNGENGRLDMKPYLDFGIFNRLRAPQKFQSVRVAHGTLAWDEEIDLDPAWVYHKTVKTESAQTGRARDARGAANF